jgi:hypothetical protein
MKKEPILRFVICIIMAFAFTLMSACTSIVLPPDTTPDTTAPTVSSTIPVNAATGVAINSAITAVFSEVMNPLTIISVTFTLKQGNTPISGTVSYSKVSAIFVPLSSLTPSTPYTATITTGAKDLAGNTLTVDFVWNFTTGEALDTTAPAVSVTIPVNGTTGVAINGAISAIFSEAIDPLSVTKTTFTLMQGDKRILGTVSYSYVSAVFVPESKLAYNTTYTATITTGTKDLAGNALTSAYAWNWTTGDALDTTAPTLTGTINVNGATNVPINTKVGATFSEAMDPLTVTNLTFTLKQGATPVSGAITYSNVSAVFIPASNLDYNTVYTVMITTGVKDLAGNALANNYTLSWTTGEVLDTIAPTVDSTSPTNLATEVATNSAITAIFSEMLDPLTVTNITFSLRLGTAPISGTVTYAGVTATFTPSNSLASGTVYTVIITTVVRDLAGNTLAGNFIWSFTTSTQIVQILPTNDDSGG